MTSDLDLENTTIETQSPRFLPPVFFLSDHARLDELDMANNTANEIPNCLMDMPCDNACVSPYTQSVERDHGAGQTWPELCLRVMYETFLVPGRVDIPNKDGKYCEVMVPPKTPSTCCIPLPSITDGDVSLKYVCRAPLASRPAASRAYRAYRTWAMTDTWIHPGSVLEISIP